MSDSFSQTWTVGQPANAINNLLKVERICIRSFACSLESATARPSSEPWLFYCFVSANSCQFASGSHY